MTRIGIFACAYFSIVFFFTLILSMLDYTHFNGIEEKEDKGMDRIWNRFYFTLETVSTVGYGEVSPKGHISRAIAGLMMFMVSIAVFEIFLNAFTRRGVTL